MKRTTMSLLLAALTAASAIFSGCGGGATAPVSETTAAVSDGETTSAAEKQKRYEYYEGHDLNGKTFMFLNAEPNTFTMYCTVLADEITGETINDAIYERNNYVMDKLNFKMAEEGYTTNDTSMIKVLDAAMAAGDATYDIVCPAFYQVANGISTGYYFNLDEISTLHLDEGWWNQTLLKETSVNNKHYIANSSMHLMALDGTWCLFFNEKIMNNYGMDLPYDLVRSGKWTYDAFLEYLKKGAQLNGDASFAKVNGTAAEWSANGKSVYGVACHGTFFPTLLYCMEAGFASKDAKDMLTVTAGSERFTTVFQKMASTLSVPGQCVVANSTGYHYSKDIFFNGRSLFIGGEIKESQVLRDMDDDFGIVPLPKWNEAQESYHSTVTRKCCALAIPVTQKDPEGAGLVLDALSYESDARVLDLYFENRIEQKGLRNDDSIEMLHIIKDVVGMDLGNAYSTCITLYNAASTEIPAGNTDVSSIIAKNEAAVKAATDTLNEAFKK